MISFTAGRCKWGSSTERAGLEEEEDERAVEELDVDIFSVSVGRTRVLLI